MTPDEIRKMVTTRDDWKRLWKFDHDMHLTTGYNGLSNVGWLVEQGIKKTIRYAILECYYAALRVIWAVRTERDDSLVIHWWKTYKRKYENLMSGDHRKSA